MFVSGFIEFNILEMMVGYILEIKMRGILYKCRGKNDYYMFLWLRVKFE